MWEDNCACWKWIQNPDWRGNQKGTLLSPHCQVQGMRENTTTRILKDSCWTQGHKEMGMQLSCSVGANGNWRGTQQTLRNRRYTGSTNNVTESFIETERELGEWWKQELEGSSLPACNEVMTTCFLVQWQASQELMLLACNLQMVINKGHTKNKSDISYLKTSRAFDVLIHSGKPNAVG